MQGCESSRISPRVARSSPPWAGRFNPVGICKTNDDAPNATTKIICGQGLIGREVAGAVGRGGTPGNVWRRAHLKFQRAAGDDLLVGQPGAGERLAVEGGGLDVDVFGGIVPRNQSERAALVVICIQRDDRLVNQRAAQDVT